MGDIQILEAQIERMGGTIAALNARAEAWKTMAGRLAAKLNSISPTWATPPDAWFHDAMALLTAHDKLKREMGEGN